MNPEILGWQINLWTACWYSYCCKKCPSIERFTNLSSSCSNFRHKSANFFQSSAKWHECAECFMKIKQNMKIGNETFTWHIVIFYPPQDSHYVSVGSVRGKWSVNIHAEKQLSSSFQCVGHWAGFPGPISCIRLYNYTSLPTKVALWRGSGKSIVLFLCSPLAYANEGGAKPPQTI